MREMERVAAAAAFRFAPLKKLKCANMHAFCLAKYQEEGRSFSSFLHFCTVWLGKRQEWIFVFKRLCIGENFLLFRTTIPFPFLLLLGARRKREGRWQGTKEKEKREKYILYEKPVGREESVGTY